MTAPASDPAPAPPPQTHPVVGVNDWGRVSDAWERVFDDVSAVGADLKTVFRGAYQAAAVDPAADLSDAVGGLGADAFVNVSERLDRGLAGARAALGALGDELHTGGSDRLHGEVEGAVKVSLYELGMLMIRMSDKLDGDVPPPRGHVAVPDPSATLPPYADETSHGEVPAGAVFVPREDSTEELPEIDLTSTPPVTPVSASDDSVTPVPEPIPVRPAAADEAWMVRPD